MAGPLLLRDALFPYSRLHSYRRFVAGIAVTETPHRILCCAPTNWEPGRADEKASYAAQISKLLRAKDLATQPRSDDPDYRKWKDKEKEILKDIEPIVRLTKDILHSRRYMDGEQLTAEDEKVVVEKLLAYHPRSEDKIGCGLESIMVDRHPQFRCSRCLFVVRTDGGWIDFSYQKCLREYIRNKYPSHAERFIREHLKRGGR
ncbi:protein DCL homolog, chloroplastic [Neltuma alba]|uniref:protein DCL homolog, chloroplastic n=1 Tax=Neltuma alba TaxID=207710 RepID=UPI0010A3E8F1|nr:protein DCL homolog, chloroplastic-like [Prosopis alba]XP_028806855.1 protein DCL homolog, chloroplastic-like [Prosopis alba]